MKFSLHEYRFHIGAGIVYIEHVPCGDDLGETWYGDDFLSAVFAHHCDKGVQSSTG